MIKAFVFPGQGSQFPGMGRALYEGNPEARELMELANEVLGFRITDIMFGEDAEALKATEVTQPSVFIHSVAAALFAQPTAADKAVSPAPGSGQNSPNAGNGFTAADAPDMVAGHSLGEFSALAVSGALEFTDALKLVAIRAREMQKCCEAAPGAMAAIIGLPDETVKTVCRGISGNAHHQGACSTMPATFEEDACSTQPHPELSGIVVPANYNCPGQVVVSGGRGAVMAACEALKAAGARRALPLQVSGAFHSPLMEPARARLAEAIAATPFHAPHCPVYQNVTALPSTDPEVIKANLLRQLTSPVLWTSTIRNMVSDGATGFVEFGPGKVLQGLIGKICAGIPEILISGVQ